VFNGAIETTTAATTALKKEHNPNKGAKMLAWRH
jgi:hypothetical protein